MFAKLASVTLGVHLRCAPVVELQRQQIHTHTAVQYIQLSSDKKTNKIISRTLSLKSAARELIPFRTF